MLLPLYVGTIGKLPPLVKLSGCLDKHQAATLPAQCCLVGSAHHHAGDFTCALGHGSFHQSILHHLGLPRLVSGGSPTTQGGDSGATLLPSSLPRPFPDLTICWRFYEFAITNGFLLSSDLPPTDAVNNQHQANGYIIKVDNSPREDVVSKYLGLLHRGQFYESHWPPRRWH